MVAAVRPVPRGVSEEAPLQPRPPGAGSVPRCDHPTATTSDTNPRVALYAATKTSGDSPRNHVYSSTEYQERHLRP